MDVDIREAERRAKRYFYDDGLTELALGVMVFLFGAYFYGESISKEGTLVKSLLDMSFFLLLVCAGFLIGRVVRFLKFRITYPRTGYVSYKKKEMGPRRRTGAAVMGALTAAALAVLTRVAPSFMAWLPALNGLLFGLAVYLFARRAEVTRFYALAAVSVVAGFAVAFAGVGDIKGLGLYYAAFGTAIFVSGLVTLILYLRRSSASREETHEP